MSPDGLVQLLCLSVDRSELGVVSEAVEDGQTEVAVECIGDSTRARARVGAIMRGLSLGGVGDAVAICLGQHGGRDMHQHLGGVKGVGGVLKGVMRGWVEKVG